LVSQDQVRIGDRVFYGHPDPSLGGILLIVLVGSAGIAAKRLEERLVQNGYDGKAAELLAAITDQRVPCFFLYLRPFYLTGRMQLKNPAHVSFPGAIRHYTAKGIIDFETALERAVRKSGPLVALGQPGEMLGAGRIAASDEDWRAKFYALARVAHLIFVVPSHKSGTKEEIDWLRQNDYLGKCVFLMPPKFSKSKLDAAKCWNQATAVLAASDTVRLPPYTYRGQIFRLGPDGSIREARTLRGLSALQKDISEFCGTT